MFTACAVTRAMARAQVEGSSGVPGTLSPLSVDEVVEAQKNDHFRKVFCNGCG